MSEYMRINSDWSLSYPAREQNEKELKKFLSEDGDSKATFECGPVIITELTPPKEKDVSTKQLLEIYRFVSSIEPYLVSGKGDMPEYLFDHCTAIINELDSIITARIGAIE